jgi:hypothetical protein
MAESKKSRKHGRNKIVCAAYRTSQRREFNKARRIIRHLRRHPTNLTALTALKRLDGVLYSAHRKALGLTAILEAA